MKRIRQLHLYFGTFFAPAIIFFAFTGALQTFGLHESPKGSTAKRPAWIAKIAEIHKNQRLPQARPERAPAAAQAQLKPKPEEEPKPEQAGAANRAPSPLPLKIFVLFMAIGLISTTLLGLYMAFKYNRDRRVVWGLLIAGTVLPIALLYL